MTLQKSSNAVWYDASVTRQRREEQNKHKSVVLWFTGLSGSGKSTLSHAIEEKLHQAGCRTFVMDGDNVRHGLCADLGFSSEDRSENVRRVSESAKLMVEAGLIVLTAFISPFRADREGARKLFSKGDFIEVHCSASLETCETRDVKGLYQRARDGKIKHFTGISSPYEAPLNPEIVINTGEQSLEESVMQVLSFCQARGLLNSDEPA